MRLRILIALLAVAAGAVALLVVTAGDRDGERPPERRIRTARAEDFLDSVGVGLHLQYVDTSYGRQDVILDRVEELGVRHVREAFPHRAPAISRGLRALARRGVSGTLVTGLDFPPDTGVAGGLRDMGPRVAAFEGPNELDVSGRPDWQRQLAGYLRSLREAIEFNGADVPVVGPSFVDPRHYRALDPAGYDVMNLHPYPDALRPEENFARRIREARDIAPRRRIVVTETGYHNAVRARGGPPSASERAAATYIPRIVLWAFGAGVERTFVYELADEKPDPGLLDAEQHFGLLRQDLSPKPAFLALRNLLRAVRRSPGPAGPSPAVPSVRAPERVERLDLTRRDGSRLVALWRPVSVWDPDGRRDLDPGEVSVRIAWPRAARDLVVSRPSAGEEPIVRRDSATSLRLELRGDVVLLSYR